MQTTIQTEIALMHTRATLDRIRTSMEWMARPTGRDAQIPLECRMNASVASVARALADVERHLATLETELAS